MKFHHFSLYTVIYPKTEDNQQSIELFQIHSSFVWPPTVSLEDVQRIDQSKSSLNVMSRFIYGQFIPCDVKLIHLFLHSPQVLVDSSIWLLLIRLQFILLIKTVTSFCGNGLPCLQNTSRKYKGKEHVKLKRRF